jgi:hypothetical protein
MDDAKHELLTLIDWLHTHAVRHIAGSTPKSAVRRLACDVHEAAGRLHQLALDAMGTGATSNGLLDIQRKLGVGTATAMEIQEVLNRRSVRDGR